MCPAIAKTSDIEIIRAANSLVEKNGPEGLVLRDVADLVGIKTPSLYKRFADRNALLSALRLEVKKSLETALQVAADYSRPAQNRELLLAMRISTSWRSIFTIQVEADVLRTGGM